MYWFYWFYTRLTWLTRLTSYLVCGISLASLEYESGVSKKYSLSVKLGELGGWCGRADWTPCCFIVWQTETWLHLFCSWCESGLKVKHECPTGIVTVLQTWFVISKQPHCFRFCFSQLTDSEQQHVSDSKQRTYLQFWNWNFLKHLTLHYIRQTENGSVPAACCNNHITSSETLHYSP